ncbi:MAG TPA: response regulator [Thermohalobaculum sp.]|nr:response regulator [Thermohalobaculum sp.]
MHGQDRSIVHVIDDDEAVRESLEALLRASGFETETYSSAEDFLNRTPSHHGCLLLDIKMPGMSGLDLLQHLIDKGRRSSAIVLTANPDERLRQRAHQLGVAAFLTKPVTEPDLLSAIADAADECKGNPS